MTSALVVDKSGCERAARAGRKARQTVAGAWAFAVLLFAVLALASALPQQEPTLPPGVQIPSASHFGAAGSGCVEPSEVARVAPC
jgi:hypothetical protein